MDGVRTIALGYNNVYLVEASGQRVLVDAGPDYRGASEALAAATEGARPGMVVVTHGHNDHAGLGRWWQDDIGVQVLVSPEDAPLVRGPHFARSGEFEAFVAYVAASGAPKQVQREVLAGLERRREWVRTAARRGTHPPARTGERWPTGLRFEPFEPDLLVDGMRLGGLVAVSCPGHTPGNIVLVEEERGLLFSGDQLLPDMTPTPGIQFMLSAEGRWERFPSLPPFLDSLKRLQERSFRRCYPGHGAVIEDAAGLIAANVAQIEQRTERVERELREAGPASMHELAERLYPRALKRRWWQIVATIQGHLDLLEARERAVCRDGAWSSTGE